jgi:hypothetical protein
MAWSGRNWLRGEMRPLSGLAQPISRIPSVVPVSDRPEINWRLDEIIRLR